MDSSKPPNSRTGDGSSVGSEPDLGGSVKASASSVGNNEPEPPPQGGDISKCQGKKISTGDEPTEDQDVNIANQCTPKKRDQSETSKGKEKVENTTDREEEIALLESIVDYYDEKGTFPFVGLNLGKKFSINRIQEHGVLADTLVLDFKILELHARFLLNELNELDCDGDVVGAMDPIDLKIYQLSNRIWGKKDNEDLNNSAKVKTVDDRGDKKGTKDSKYVKDLTEQESDGESDTKDSSEGETDDESDTEDSKSKLIETSDVSDSKDSKTSSSEDLAESETDAKRSSSTGSKNSSETEANDDQIDHDGSEHVRLDSKASSSSFLEQNRNAQKEQSTRNQQAVEEADDGVHLLSISLMSAGIGVVIMIILALIMAIREI